MCVFVQSVVDPGVATGCKKANLRTAGADPVFLVAGGGDV